jgi:serine protease inhibitor
MAAAQRSGRPTRLLSMDRIWNRRQVLTGLTLAALALGAGGTLAGCAKTPALITADIGRDPRTELGSEVQEMLSSFTAALMLRVGISDNLISSPLSVAIVLAMIRNGAAEQTAAEMDAALGLPDLPQLNAGMNSVLLALADRSGQRKRADGSKGKIALSLAQQVWGQQETVWERPFLEALARSYGTGVAAVDFARSVATTKEINGWVADHTGDKITDILPPDAIDESTKMALANAIYLKAPWDEEFTKTGPGSFTTPGGEVSVEMMERSARLPIVRLPGWNAVSVPYIGSELGMALLQCEPGGEEDMLAELADGGLFLTLTGWAEGLVDLTMPLFGFRSKLALSDQLAAMGMPTAFTRDADFSGMTKQQRLKIDEVYHEGWIAVDEKGTEAAAATVATMTDTSAPVGETLVMRLDRPFAFFIHDRVLGVPVMAGWVADPSR